MAISKDDLERAFDRGYDFGENHGRERLIRHYLPQLKLSLEQLQTLDEFKARHGHAATTLKNIILAFGDEMKKGR